MGRQEESTKKVTTYKERQISTRREPINIRQVGEISGNLKIYIEDFVMSYIDNLVKERKKKMGHAVLLGRCEKKNGKTMVFVSGAVHMEEGFPEEGQAFSNETWEKIYENIKLYFDGLEIVGWVELVEEARKDRVDKDISYIHRNQFSGKEKLLLLYDYLEKELYFYVREQGEFKYQTGYYIYYEKNEAMKNYRLSKQKSFGVEEEYEDRVLEGVRKKMAKQEEEKSKRNIYIAGGTAVAVATVALLMLSAFMGNQAKIQELEKTVETMTEKLNESEEDSTKKNNGSSMREDDGSSTVSWQEAAGKDGSTDESGDKQPEASGIDEDGKSGGEEDGSTDGSAGKQPEAAGINGDGKTDSTEDGSTDEGGDKQLEVSGIGGGKADSEENAEDGSADGSVAIRPDSKGSAGSDENSQGGKKTVSGQEDADAKDKGKGENSDAKTDGESADAGFSMDGESMEAASILGYYTVKKGDTLSQISSRYYNTITCTGLICEANDIEDADEIFPGQVLILPKK